MFSTFKGNNSKSRHTRVIVHIFCILSYNTLHVHLCSISLKYLERFSHKNVTDGQTNEHTERETHIRGGGTLYLPTDICFGVKLI